ncbi:MAG: DUF493 domain-containing protein [Planctomycetota bacterium]
MNAPDDAEKRQQSIDLLNNTHEFPQPLMVKVIGKQHSDFVKQVAQLVESHLQLTEPPEVQTRETAGGRHVSVTLEPTFESAEQVLDLYEQLRALPDVVMLL